MVFPILSHFRLYVSMFTYVFPWFFPMFFHVLIPAVAVIFQDEVAVAAVAGAEESQQLVGR